MIDDARSEHAELQQKNLDNVRFYTSRKRPASLYDNTVAATIIE